MQNAILLRFWFLIPSTASFPHRVRIPSPNPDFLHSEEGPCWHPGCPKPGYGMGLSLHLAGGEGKLLTGLLDLRQWPCRTAVCSLPDLCMVEPEPQARPLAIKAGNPAGESPCDTGLDSHPSITTQN